MGMAKLVHKPHKRPEIAYNIPNGTDHFWVSETSIKFPHTAKEAQIKRTHVGTDIVDTFSEFSFLSKDNHFGMF